MGQIRQLLRCQTTIRTDHARRAGKGSLIVLIAAIILLAAIFFGLLLPGIRQAREAAFRTTCKSHLKLIGSAIHNYHDFFGCFPPAFSVDAKGNKLHSWRTLILPFLNQKTLYDSIDLSVPWDHPLNTKARDHVVEVYSCPSLGKQDNITPYTAIISQTSCFPDSESRCVKDIKDGTSNTLLIVERPIGEGVPWMQPDDVSDKRFLGATADQRYIHSGGCFGLLADGSVRFLSEDLDQGTRAALTTIAGGETISEF